MMAVQSPSGNNNVARPATAMTPVSQDNKYWKNTRKFDRMKTMTVRNNSALNRIIVDIDNQDYELVGNLNPIHQYVISERINE